MTTIDTKEYKKAIGRIFSIDWDTLTDDWAGDDENAQAFTSEDLTTAEDLAEFSYENLRLFKETYHWSLNKMTRLRKLLDWVHEARHTTAHWQDLQKEHITGRALASDSSTSPSAGNRTFDFSNVSDAVPKTRDIKLDLKTMQELKDDRTFCSYFGALKT